MTGYFTNGSKIQNNREVNDLSFLCLSQLVSPPAEELAQTSSRLEPTPLPFMKVGGQFWDGTGINFAP